MTVDSPFLFRQAVAAIDAGDAAALEGLLTAHPRLLREREESGEGYFHRPYLLWFVAENPVRRGSLPGNIVEITRVLLDALARHGVDSRVEQARYTLSLVASGRVPRESGFQLALIDVLVDAGASPSSALGAALAHKEIDAALRLLERGAEVTLLAAVCLGRHDDVLRLAEAATAAERQTALIAAAFYGNERATRELLALGTDVNGYGPAGFHPHATALHQAVASGSRETVEILVDAGADLTARDRVYLGTPLGWAEHLEQPAIAELLRGRGAEG